MGLRMRLYPAPDPDLGAFSIAPQTLKAWLRYARSRPEVSLRESWRELDAILGATDPAPSASPLTPRGATWNFPGASERGAFALSSKATAQLREALDRVTRTQVEAQVRRRWMVEAMNAGAASERDAAELTAAADELLQYLRLLRETCAFAETKGYGLLMELSEDT